MTLSKIVCLTLAAAVLAGCASTPSDEVPSEAMKISSAAGLQGVHDISYRKVQQGAQGPSVAGKTRAFDATLSYYAIGAAGGIVDLAGQNVSGGYRQFVAWVPESEAANGEEAVAKTKALLEDSSHWPELQNNLKGKWAWKAYPRRMPYGDNRLDTFLNPVKSFVFTNPTLTDAPSFIGGKAYGPIYFSAPEVVTWTRAKTNNENYSRISKALPEWIYLYTPNVETDKPVPGIYNKGDLLVFVSQPKR